MTNHPPAPPTWQKYVLEGRIVTMGPQSVIADGAIYIENGEIKAVQDASEPVPQGFKDVLRVRTGDSIYPGLIELHNHLSYNAMPLWDVPRRYTNNGQWKRHEDYRRLITKPSQVLGGTAGVVEALIRYVECRCLLGGVTTSQGITLSSAPGLRSFYKGIVRNVEQTLDPTLPRASTKIANPSTGGAEAYLDRLKGQTCYLQHLSEGVDTTARGWFRRLQLPNGDWAINEALCGIHSAALTPEDFEIVAARGGSMVWSPLSNFLLYGGTADIEAAKASGILMGIGCDWAPSGSKNLQGELKVCWLTSEERGGVFTTQEIVEMATINPAKILKWHSKIGSIETGKLADLVCVNGQSGDPYMKLIEARETSITLVVINGVPRVGQTRIMNGFGIEFEAIKVGRSNRGLYLEDEGTHELVQGLSLTEATDRLETAMGRLPELAEALDNALATGLFTGSEVVVGGETSTWQIISDLQEDDEELERELGLAALPLATYVQPMRLDGITVADDRQYLRNLVAARNLPEFVKRGLPGLYGKSIPIPDSAGFLMTTRQPMPPQLYTTQELRTFLRTSGQLMLSDRKRIVDQALVLLEENYVHLPLKRAMHAVDPVQRLRLLRHQLDEVDEGALPPEIEFHNEMTRIFNSMRDLHTTYRLPRPFRSKTAWLPFLIEEFWEHDHRKYVVTKVVADAGPDSFEPGVEVMHWNGIPIETAVARNAERQAGSNPAARHARGLDSLTLRPLSRALHPDEDWVTLRYRGLSGEDREYKQEWLVSELGRTPGRIYLESLSTEATAVGLDAQTDDVQEAKKALFAGSLVIAEGRISEDESVESTPDAATAMMASANVFRSESVTTQHGEFGYIRIFTFNVWAADAFVTEFVRRISDLPQNGLIIDVRGNGGGLIHAAEQLLQVLTPNRIQPQKAQFINTPLNLQLCRNYEKPTNRLPNFSLGEWIDSISQSVRTGATYSLGHAITPENKANDRGQKYYGPKVLITDALCYSATDMFAAGFKDHDIGVVLGTSENTGAGGANVWSHRLLQELARPTHLQDEVIPSPYAPLPQGADLRVAIRRTVRVGEAAGTVVEDLGIKPDHIHRMTRDDVLCGNKDLIEEAGRILAPKKTYSIDVRLETRWQALPIAHVEYENLDWLNVVVDGRPRRSYDVTGGTAVIDLQEVVGDVSGGRAVLEFRGYKKDKLVAAWRGTVP